MLALQGTLPTDIVVAQRNLNFLGTNLPAFEGLDSNNSSFGVLELNKSVAFAHIGNVIANEFDEINDAIHTAHFAQILLINL